MVLLDARRAAMPHCFEFIPTEASPVHWPSARPAHMAQSFPKLIDLSQDSFIGLLDIDQMHDRHPTGAAGQPKYFRTIAFGIEVVTAERADMIHHRVDPQTFGYQSPMKDTQIVERRYAERDLRGARSD